ncbi:MAG: hypothetical protein HQM09_06605 [Candidatus Riflebacteria bacterium]|nr:hypothetical protein [Candidatus Riflebacteria bacterium]
MNRFFGKLFSGALITFSLTGSVWAAEPWIDATHMFDQEVKALAMQVPLETRQGLAKRTRAPAPVPKIYKVGDIEKFWTKNIKENTSVQIEAVCKAVGKNCYIFLEQGQSVSDAAIAKVQQDFDDKVYSTDTANFGSEWKPGIDGDEKITLLMLDIQDGWTEGSKSGYVAGYFFAGDEFLQSQIPANIPVKSNEREMMYLDIHPGDPSSSNYLAVVAHEFQHMIHFIHDPKEMTWVNEACSQIATYLCGYGHQSQITSWMQTPNNSLTAWAKDNMLANYGEVYLWNYYLLNRYMPTDAARAAFFRKLVDDKSHGTAGYEKLLKGLKTTFRTAFVEFMVANYTNLPQLEKGQYAYDKSLARFRLPPVAMLKTLPGVFKDKACLFGAEAVKVDLTGAKETVTVSFAGQDADFIVGAVLSDSRDQLTPAITWIQMGKTIPEGLSTPAGATSVGGSLDLNVGKFDSLTLVVAAVPRSQGQYDDVPTAQSPWEVAVKDKGAVVARAPRPAASAEQLIAEYRMTAAALPQSERDGQAVGLTNLDTLAFEITHNAREGLETGSTGAFDQLIKAASDPVAKKALRPLAKTMAEQLSAWSLQNRGDDSAVEQKIEALKSF